MLASRIYNGVNAVLYAVYGGIGALAPNTALGANALETVGVHGSHSIRALWGAIFVLGVLIAYRGFSSQTARITTLSIALVSAGLAVARLIGMVLDGTAGMESDQFGPLAIEATMTIVGLVIYRMTKSRFA